MAQGTFILRGGVELEPEVEHICPDYELYGITDTAYGFLTRGCPRGCDFCIVKDKEGRCSKKVADLSEFWGGQPNIKLLDPNTFACKDWKDCIEQLIDSRARVDFTQGIDIRIMDEEKAEMLKRVKTKMLHFAWDNYEDKDMIVPKLKMFKEVTGIARTKTTVYVLTNFNTTTEQDLERIYTLRDLGYDPYVMIFDKQNTKPGDIVRRMQRWVNAKPIFGSCKRFEDYSA